MKNITRQTGNKCICLVDRGFKILKYFPCSSPAKCQPCWSVGWGWAWPVMVTGKGLEIQSSLIQETTSEATKNLPRARDQMKTCIPDYPPCAVCFLRTELRTAAPRYKVNTGYHQSFLTITLEALSWHKGHRVMCWALESHGPRCKQTFWGLGFSFFFPLSGNNFEKSLRNIQETRIKGTSVRWRQRGRRL